MDDFQNIYTSELSPDICMYCTSTGYFTLDRTDGGAQLVLWQNCKYTVGLHQSYLDSTVPKCISATDQ